MKLDQTRHNVNVLVTGDVYLALQEMVREADQDPKRSAPTVTQSTFVEGLIINEIEKRERESGTQTSE